jgi:long-chain fatty acid transport protein
MRRRGPGASAALIAGAITLAAGARPAPASPLDLFGFGGRSPGLAGAGLATTTDYEAVFLDPAGLADVDRKRATIGGLYGDFALQLDGVDTGTEPARGLVVGGQVPMPLGGALRGRVGLGFGFFVPTAAINRVRAPRPGTPTYALLESRSQVVGLMVAVGVRVRPRLAVGLGVNALAVLRGGIAVTTDGSGRFTTQSEQRLLTRFAPIAGLRYHWRDDVEVGVVARAPSRSDYDIVVTSDLGDVLPLTLPAIRIAGNAQYDPWTVAAEAAWRASDTLTVTGQLAWQHWSGFPLPTENPVGGTPAQDPPGFHDTAVPRLAVERVAPALGGRLALRAGYAFLWSPAPEMRGRQSLLDNHRHLLAAGVGLAWPGRALPLHVDAWVQLHQLQARRHEKDVGLFPPGESVPFDVLATGGRIVVGGLTVGIDL